MQPHDLRNYLMTARLRNAECQRNRPLHRDMEKRAHKFRVIRPGCDKSAQNRHCRPSFGPSGWGHAAPAVGCSRARLDADQDAALDPAAQNRSGATTVGQPCLDALAEAPRRPHCRVLTDHSTAIRGRLMSRRWHWAFPDSFACPAEPRAGRDRRHEAAVTVSQTR